ncbi:unnamed protein product [Arabis nemorensis]|uniref:Uncharacterized protein n=1 Tax=Arabis nemorensis TaxID=586526 RepID=A0A565APR9_9BRAS|nr:unnamed protein product [Arabis nemorensis]
MNKSNKLVDKSYNVMNKLNDVMIKLFYVNWSFFAVGVGVFALLPNLAPRPLINLQEMCHIDFFALLKTTGTVGFFNLFLFLGDYLKASQDLSICLAGLGLYFYLLALDIEFGVEDDLGLCDALLLALYGTLLPKLHISAWIIFVAFFFMVLIKQVKAPVANPANDVENPLALQLVPSTNGLSSPTASNPSSTTPNPSATASNLVTLNPIEPSSIEPTTVSHNSFCHHNHRYQPETHMALVPLELFEDTPKPFQEAAANAKAEDLAPNADTKKSAPNAEALDLAPNAYSKWAYILTVTLRVMQPHKQRLRGGWMARTGRTAPVASRVVMSDGSEAIGGSE